ncbi:MAG: protein kinase [Prevotella sp.]|nr:protein kinase [Prevotella sp.]
MEKKIIGALPKGTPLQHGTYIIERALGQGATGITYLASMSTQLAGNLSEFSQKVPVAIKEFYFKDECSRESTTQNVVIANTNYDVKVAQFKKSFVKEARRIAALSHQNIVHVLGIFEENKTVYYVMQYFNGGSIKDLIDEKGALPVDKAVKYATQVASALNYMHGKNMCHYDLKPGNIMLSDDDNARLIDFGIAKNYDNNGQETSTTPPGLTKGYAPLEQYTSVTEFSPKIDVYSLGATLYAMLTGQTPPEPMKWIGGDFTQKPDNVPDSLWGIVRSAMSIGVKERPSMEELKLMLEYYSRDKAGSSEKTIIPHADTDEETHYEKRVYEEKKNNNGDVKKPTDHPNNQEIIGSHIPEPNPNPKKKFLFYALLLLIGLIAFIGGFWLMSGNKTVSVPSAVDSTTVSTIYDSKGEAVMTFTGEVSNGQPNGSGILTYIKDNVKDRYEGQLKNGLRADSAAALYFKNGDIFRGGFENDHFTTGTYYVNESGEYFQGKFKNDQPWNGVWYDEHHNVLSRVEKGIEK